MMGTILTIITTVAAGLLLAAIVFIAKSYFGTQPKLRIRLHPGMSNSSANCMGNMEITWRECLELYNLTSFPALEVSFCWLNADQALPVSEPIPPHVNPMETTLCEFKVIKEFPREEVTACHDRFTQLLPEELRSFVLIVQYKNDKGIPFFTRFERNGDEEFSSYYRRRPKV